MSIERWLVLADEMIDSRILGLTSKPGTDLRSWEIEFWFVRAHAVSDEAILGAFTYAPGRLGNTKLVRRYGVEHDDVLTFVADVEEHFRFAVPADRAMRSGRGR